MNLIFKTKSNEVYNYYSIVLLLVIIFVIIHILLLFHKNFTNINLI